MIFCRGCTFDLSFVGEVCPLLKCPLLEVSLNNKPSFRSYSVYSICSKIFISFSGVAFPPSISRVSKVFSYSKKGKGLTTGRLQVPCLLEYSPVSPWLLAACPQTLSLGQPWLHSSSLHFADGFSPLVWTESASGPVP